MIWQRFRGNRLAVLGLVLLISLLLLAIAGPFISGHSYDNTELELKNLPPDSRFWFGTDDLGRDLFTRVWTGARISLAIGLTAALLDLAIGALWGGIAGLAGGAIDTAMMRTADVLYSLPYLLVAILLLVIMGPGLLTLLAAMTVIGWITMARIVRGQALLLKKQEFVLAAEALGASFRHQLIRHILPNTLGPIIVTLTFTIPGAIFTEAFLSFLGLGIQAPLSSLGSMISDGLPAMSYYPWRLFFPGLCLSLTLLAFNLVGEGLRDAFDVREHV